MNKFTKWQRISYFKQMFNEGGTDDKGASGKSESEKTGDSGAKDGKSKDGGSQDKGADEKKYSDADLDKIINQKFAKWQKDQEKAVSEAEKLAKMTEQEKAEHERDEIKKELEALKKANNLAEMGKQARKMLAEENINLPDDLVNLIIADSAEATKETVQQFSKLFKAAVQDAVKEALKGKTPGTGSSSGTITKEQIMKITDRAERQSMIKKHRDLFK